MSAASLASPAGSLALRGFWYLRHGETDRNALRLTQGNVEVPLNATGRAQAAAAGAALVGRGITCILSSPLGRARDTAQAVASALGLPLEIRPALHEVDLGPMDNQPMGPWFDDWVAGTYASPGVEPFARLRDRAVVAVNACTDGRDWPLIVGHGAFFRALRSAMGLTANVRLPHGTPVRLAPPAPGQAEWQLAPVT